MTGKSLTEILIGHLRTVSVHYWPGIDAMTIDSILGCYSQAAKDGHVPGRAELLVQYPEFGADIDAFFEFSPPINLCAPCENSAFFPGETLRAD